MNVIIYSTKACPYCVMAKQYFNNKGIEFKDFDVSEDQQKAQEMMDKSGQLGVPVIDIDGKIIVGFDRQKIESIVNKKKK